jgi:hypothetical protein
MRGTLGANEAHVLPKVWHCDGVDVFPREDLLLSRHEEIFSEVLPNTLHFLQRDHCLLKIPVVDSKRQQLRLSRESNIAL